MEISGRILAVIVAAVFLRQALAATHAVGGSQGWDESTDFDTWASAQTFKVGDELGTYVPSIFLLRFHIASRISPYQYDDIY